MKLIDSAGLAAIITAYLYCVSTAFTHGYFHTLGLDSDLLDRSFHQVIYSGLIQSLSNILWLFIAMFYITIFHFSWQKASRSDIWVKSWLVRALNRMKSVCGFENKSALSGETRAERRVIAALGLIVAFVGLIFVLRFHEHDGVERAQKIINKIRKSPKANFSSSSYDNEMIFLYCGARNCAGYDPKINRIIYVPQQTLTVSAKKIEPKLN